MMSKSETQPSSGKLSQLVRSIFPIAEWLPKYQISFLRWDLIAGLTLAFFVMPESLAYAVLAGVPPQYGVYCCLAGGFFFALFSTSRQVAVGPTSAISLMIGTSVAVIAGGDMQRCIAIAGLVAFVIGILCIIAYILKLNSIVNFISESILLGFKAGAALCIAATQLPKFFGVEGTSGNFFIRIHSLLQHLPETNVATLLLGVIGFALLFAGTKIFPGKPVSLFVLIASILAITFTSLSSHGIHLTGEIPSGLPSVGRPSLRPTDVEGILGLALACFLMGYIETTSAARTFAQKNNYQVDTRQELLSLGFANLASAFASGYAVAGGLSQSTVNDKAGAKTPLALITCSITLAGLLFFTGLLTNLPEVILGAIVLDAILGLIKVKELKQLYNISKLEFAIAMTAFAGVLLLGILKGVMIAAVASIVLLLRRTSNPHVAIIGKVPGTNLYSDIDRHSNNEVFNNLLILRVESSFFYFNVENIYKTIWKYINSTNGHVQMLIINMTSSAYVDVAGTKMLLHLSKELADKKIKLRIVEARSGVRDLLRKQGMEEHVGPISRHISCNDVVEEFLAGR
jgi:high affinity sulfate transporter 1